MLAKERNRPQAASLPSVPFDQKLIVTLSGFLRKPSMTVNPKRFRRRVAGPRQLLRAVAGAEKRQ
jgi:hypothetical protein